MANSRPRSSAKKPAKKAVAKRAPSSRRPGRRPPARPSAKRGGAGERAPQFTGRALVLMAIVLLLIASYTSTLHTWWSQRQEIQTTKAEIAMREAEIKNLEARKDRWEDPAYVRQQARDRFGWVLPGEVGYRVIGSDGTVSGATLDEPIEDKGPQWYDTLYESVELAGKEPKQLEPEAPVEPGEIASD